jgi:hypothetical protein
MKRIMLVTTAALALLGFQARPARAQIPTMLVAQQQQYALQELQNQRQSADALLASVTGSTAGTTAIAANVPTFGATGP